MFLWNRYIFKFSYVVRDAVKSSRPCPFSVYFIKNRYSPSRQPDDILLYNYGTMRWLWNKPSFHICLDYRMENSMKTSKFSSTELPIITILLVQTERGQIGWGRLKGSSERRNVKEDKRWHRYYPKFRELYSRCINLLLITALKYLTEH